jgi:hypothetical protein
MARVIALMALVALGLTQAPVHEPVHGRRQAISAAVTQRSGRGSSTTVAHLTIWLREIRNQVHEIHFCLSPPRLAVAESKPYSDQGGSAALRRGPASAPALPWEARRRTPGHNRDVATRSPQLIASTDGMRPWGYLPCGARLAPGRGARRVHPRHALTTRFCGRDRREVQNLQVDL